MEANQSDAYFEIIEHLSKYGLSKEIIITDFVYGLYPPISNTYTIDHRYVEVRALFNLMKSNQHVTSFMPSGDVRGFEDIPKAANSDQLRAQITVEGLKFYSSIQSNKSLIDTNKSIITTNSSVKTTNEAIVTNQERQSNFYIITLILTAINLMVGGGILYATLTSNSDKQEIETLRTQIVNQHKELKLLQSLKADTIRYVLHYPKSKNAKK